MILIVAAMQEEVKYVLQNLTNKKIINNNPLVYNGLLNNKEFDVLITGIGKTLAAYSLGKYLGLNKKIDLVINPGFVGGSKHCKINNIYKVSTCSFSDYDLSFFGDKTPTFNTNKNVLSLSTKDSAYLYTADRFVTSDLGYDIKYLCDMEATSLYQVCDIENINIISLKFVSDIIGDKSQLNTYLNSKEKIDSSFELYNAILEVIK